MKCRNYEDKTIVWFGSKGLKADGTKISAENYINERNATATSIEQKLSIIKGELWTNINFGLPLFDKTKSRAVIDASVIGIVVRHPDVIKILEFESSIESHKYSLRCKILSKYGELSLSL